MSRTQFTKSFLLIIGVCFLFLWQNCGPAPSVKSFSYDIEQMSLGSGDEPIEENLIIIEGEPFELFSGSIRSSFQELNLKQLFWEYTDLRGETTQLKDLSFLKRQSSGEGLSFVDTAAEFPEDIGTYQVYYIKNNKKVIEKVFNIDIVPNIKIIDTNFFDTNLNPNQNYTLTVETDTSEFKDTFIWFYKDEELTLRQARQRGSRKFFEIEDICQNAGVYSLQIIREYNNGNSNIFEMPEIIIKAHDGSCEDSNFQEQAIEISERDVTQCPNGEVLLDNNCVIKNELCEIKGLPGIKHHLSEGCVSQSSVFIQQELGDGNFFEELKKHSEELLAKNCNINQYEINGQCIMKKKECSIEYGKNNRGFEYYSLKKLSYGKCFINECTKGFKGDLGNTSCIPECETGPGYKLGTTCAQEVSSCEINGAIAAQEYFRFNQTFGECLVSKCLDDKLIGNNGSSCVTDCSSSEVKIGDQCFMIERPCNIDNGVGKEVLNQQTATYNQCEIISCEQGFNPVVLEGVYPSCQRAGNQNNGG